MLAELAALGEASGRFHGEVARHADRIARADTLESVAGAVQELVGEARDIEAVFGQAQRPTR
ncbi:hypothetical protein ABXN37_01120 [Piscinibacter sakaiensis]|uniref:hypothetical protein n=1 Tax=Piscinibacter sakaiensis TaxID=1547922 RepID=UPI0037276DA0